MFITFEGIEGTGKTTQIARLAAWLREQGQEVRVTREPGGSRLGVELRRLLLDVSSADLTPPAELFLYLADRAQHVATVIRPALEDGQVVLCDRFADSTIVYQGYGRGLDPLKLYEMTSMAVGETWPELSILLDIEPVVGLARAQERLLRDGKLSSEGRFEAESMMFHERIRRGYLDWAGRNPRRFRIVNATPPPEVVAAEIRHAVADLLAREPRH